MQHLHCLLGAHRMSAGKRQQPIAELLCCPFRIAIPSVVRESRRGVDILAVSCRVEVQVDAREEHARRWSMKGEERRESETVE